MMFPKLYAMHYLNHRGAVNWRKIKISYFFVGETTFYPPKQVLFSAYDYEKKDFRIFSANRILKIEEITENEWCPPAPPHTENMQKNIDVSEYQEWGGFKGN